ncbi:peptide ABC transporter substrate-binding protein [Patescibacteria group bacterium]|nr:peptide ABC transporter substrate-binding protein [Patescibacteria group bacterium]MBU1612968.1 peptide ABC transporter substrate-binding protein [Patescibacteria group bacterium]
MKWNNFFSSKPIAHKPLVRNFDRKLIQNVNRSILPSFRQLKYIGRFFGKNEKRTIGISSAIIAITLVGWGVFFVVSHVSSLPKDGGEYSEAMIGQPQFINPIFSSTNDVDSDLVSLSFTGLFRYDKEQKLVPDLASEYMISDDKKIYTVTLRPNIFWSDGEPFSASDILYTFENIQNPEVGSPLYPTFQGVVVEQIEENQVRFVLKEPFAPFLHSLTVGILPEHVWTNIPPSGMRLAKNNLRPVGTGPWKFEKMVKDDSGTVQSYTLSRNEKYYGKIPYLKTAVFRFYTDYQGAAEALRTGNVSAISFLPRELKNKVSKRDLNIYSLELPQYSALFFNQAQNSVLKDSDMRMALAKALDKRSILDEALNGEGIVIESPVLSGQVGYYPEIQKIGYDSDDANILLDKKWGRVSPEDYFKLKYDELIKIRQAEIDEVSENPSSTPEMVSSTIEKIESETTNNVRQGMNSDQLYYRKDKSGKILALIITTADTPEYIKAAEVISKMWRDVGIVTEVRSVPSRQFSREALKPRQYEILLYGEILGSDPDPFPFWHSSQTEFPGLNLALFANRNADKLLEDARVKEKDEDRVELYQKFQDILVKELPAIFLYSPSYTFAANKQIKGVDVNKILNPAERFNSMGYWYIKTKWEWN